MRDEELRQALKIYAYFLEHKGVLKSADSPDLYASCQQKEIRQILASFAEVLKVAFVNAGDRIYMLPQINNTTFGMSRREYRENLGSSVRAIDAFTISYIQMFLFSIFFNNKTYAPDYIPFISQEEFEKEVNQLFDQMAAEPDRLDQLDGLHQMNFRKVTDNWQSKLLEDGQSPLTKRGTIRRALGQLERQNLITQPENIIRATEELCDKFYNYYLNEDRVKEINELFSSFDAGGENA